MPRPNRPKKKPIETREESSLEKEIQNFTNFTNTFTTSIPSIPFSLLSPEQHLQKALESLTQAYHGLKEEEKKE
jgi:hypothetical protein